MSMKISKFLSGCFVILICCYSLVAQQTTIQLTGRILDPTGSIISGISVSVYSQNKTKYETYADDNGVYSLNLPEGTYNLEINKQDVKYNGFKFVKFNNYQVVLTQNGKLNFDIALPLEGDGVLCELIISGYPEKSNESKKKSKKIIKGKINK